MSPERTELEELASILRKAGWSANPPEQATADMDSLFHDCWKICTPFTLISVERGWALAEAVRYVSASAIPGDIVECGVWKGGACLLASLILNSVEPSGQRRIWLYDTFEGMTEPGREDRIAASGQLLSERSPEGWWAAGLGIVRQTLKNSPLQDERFSFVSGKVEETLEQTVPESISVLRLDTDWYESTLKELEILYPRLSSGGVLIVDDYGHFTGARKAVDEYFAGQNLPILKHRSDYTGRVIVKS